MIELNRDKIMIHNLILGNGQQEGCNNCEIFSVLNLHMTILLKVSAIWKNPYMKFNSIIQLLLEYNTEYLNNFN